MRKLYAIQRKNGSLDGWSIDGWSSGIYIWKVKKHANEYIERYPSTSLNGAKVVPVEIRVIK